MNTKRISLALLIGLLLLILPMPSAAGFEDAYVIPRLVAGELDGIIYTPKLSFKNLSNKDCRRKFQLLEEDFNPAGGVFEFNGSQDCRRNPACPSCRLAQGLSGKLKKIDAGGYTGFGYLDPRGGPAEEDRMGILTARCRGG